MAQLSFEKRVQIDALDFKVSSKGTNYYYVHMIDPFTGDSVRYSCSESVYNQLLDLVPVLCDIRVRFQSWFDETIVRGGQREFVFYCNPLNTL